MRNQIRYFQVINIHKNIFKKADKELKESYLEHKFDYNYELKNNYLSIIFNSAKTADEIDFIIFYTFSLAVRERNYYTNTAEIENYFLTNYNFHFFDSKQSHLLFSLDFNLSFEDFIKIIKPNLFFLLHQEVEIEKQKINKENKLVVLNFDFLLCGKENSLLLYYSTIFNTKPIIEFDNVFSLVAFTLKMLFATVCTTVDTNLDGLFFTDENNFNHFYNEIVRKYFTVDNSFNWGKRKIIPIDCDFVGFYKTKILEKHILIQDFEQIQNLFNSNLPLIEVK